MDLEAEMRSWAARGAAGREALVAPQRAAALAGARAGVLWQGAASLTDSRERAIRREIRLRGAARRERLPGLVRNGRPAGRPPLPTQ